MEIQENEGVEKNEYGKEKLWFWHSSKQRAGEETKARDP